MLAQVCTSDHAAMDEAPIIRLEQAAVVFQRLVQDWAVDRHSCVIDPCVDSSKMLNGLIGDVLHFIKLCDVAGDVNRFATCIIDFLRHDAEYFFISGDRKSTRMNSSH